MFVLTVVMNGGELDKMKSADWKRVKVHQWLIYPTETIGVVKCEVIEVDVKIAEPLPTFHYDRPYGLTKDTGTVKIRYTINDVPQEEIENLANLVAYSETTFRELQSAYQKWQEYKAYSENLKENSLTLIQQRRQE